MVRISATETERRFGKIPFVLHTGWKIYILEVVFTLKYEADEYIKKMSDKGYDLAVKSIKRDSLVTMDRKSQEFARIYLLYFSR